ncbi:MAG: hypothetical protein OEZ58_09500 [Gammaproteobacteria bacterium]|nr:hypothetical protein [Gammaproteobacteria bacterium]
MGSEYVRIPSDINGVEIEFGEQVMASAMHPRLLEALFFCIKPDVVNGLLLQRIHISSAKTFSGTGRHLVGKAVDISRINGIFIAHGYRISPAITELADGIQKCFDQFEFRRENYGPAYQTYMGKAKPMDGYMDHIHLAVN